MAHYAACLVSTKIRGKGKHLNGYYNEKVAYKCCLVEQ